MVGEFGIGIISKIVIPEAPTKQIHTHIYACNHTYGYGTLQDPEWQREWVQVYDLILYNNIY